MQVDVQTFLRLVENNKSLAFFDIESTGREADYDSVLVISVKPYHSKPKSFSVTQVGNDSKILKEARDYLNMFDAWCTYYGKGFDCQFINTRLLRHKSRPLNLVPHIDMYFQLRGKTLLGRRSMAHYAEFMRLKTQKMSVSPDVWSDASWKTKENLPILVRRCESDTEVLEQVYDEAKHLIRDIKV